MLNHILMFILAVAFGVFGAYMGWSYGVVIGIIIGLFLINVAFFLYVILYSNNLPLIVRVLKSNKKEPSYAYVLALKDNNLQEAKEQLQKTIIRYKNSTHKANFESLLALLNKDFEAARKYASQIKDEDVQAYTLALIDTHEGKGEQHLGKSFSKPWMSPAIDATHYLLNNNKQMYEQAKYEVFSNSKGLQLASNVYAFQFNEYQLLPKSAEANLSQA